MPCHYDIRAIDWAFIQQVDLVCAGFPCQPFSLAGKRRGKHDDRYLWPEVVRCLAVLRPTWFIGENVYGLLHLGIEQVCADLEALGYQVAVLGIPACAVDAPHLRKRLWIVAHTESDLRGTMADAIGESAERGYDRAERRQRSTEKIVCDSGKRGRSEDGWRQTESGVGGTLDGLSSWLDGFDMTYWNSGWEDGFARVASCVPARMDRLKGLGNAVVPQVVEALGRMILAVHYGRLEEVRRQGS